jgi:hypothetical protein
MWAIEIIAWHSIHRLLSKQQIHGRLSDTGVPLFSRKMGQICLFDHPRVRSGETFQSVVLLDDRGQILGFIIGHGLVYRRKHRES